ncbi:MAG: DUF4058 family protein [Planctomycetes bacterium]|nr:DUF4058 family protein [Planctomycetota bacterium]
MKSPFPGMDPYLEKHWRDIHASLIIYARDQIEEQLPSNLVARVEERLIVEPEDGEDRAIYPDVRVMEQRNRDQGSSIAVLAGPATAEPIIVDYEKTTETFVRILERGARTRLITVIEILSFSNKQPGESQDQYLQKQKELLRSAVSLVEIDLLRAGKRVLALPATRIPLRARTTYQACVRRGWRPSRFEIYRLPLTAPLLPIPIPLRKKDADIRLDLQTLVDQAYRKGRYFQTIDYSEPPDPPFKRAEARWADELLGKTRKR